jgi:hypothetical protein
MQFFTALFTALILAVSTNATPIHVAERSELAELIVVAPPVTSPSQGEIWQVGSTQLVTWDASNIPESAKNRTGIILLGYIDGDTLSEHLNYTNPLASGFPLTAGCQNVTVPDVLPKTTYIIILLGDSGNSSPQFSIE